MITAKSIDIDGSKPVNSIKIDGQEFPYFLSDQGIRIEYTGQGVAVVWLPVLAERVSIVADGEVT